MELMIIIFTLAIIPVIVFPVAYVWYLNIGGIISWWRNRRKVDKT